jgi:hypothetical protein
MKIILTETQLNKIKNVVETLYQEGFSFEDISNYTSLSLGEVVTLLKDYDYEIDCEMAYDLIIKLYDNTDLFRKVVRTENYTLEFFYSKTEGAIDYSYETEKYGLYGYGTPYWNGECYLPIENIEIVDNVNGETEDYEPYSKIDLPNRFDTISEFFDWFNNDYFKIMKKTLERFSKDY